MPSQDDILIGPHRIRPALNRIDGPQGTVRLEPRIMDVLVLLAQRAGEVVSRDELHSEIWAGTIVSEDVINRSISELRKALGDSHRNPVYIQTIPKRGYRLVAPVGAPRVHAKKTPRMAWIVPVIALVALSWWLGTWSAESTAIPDAYTTRPLTSEPGLENWPVLSPDGHRVAWAHRPDSSLVSHIYVRLVQDEAVHILTGGPAWDTRPWWSPDGTHIYFVRFRSGGCSVMRIPSLGGFAEAQADCTGTVYPDISLGVDGETMLMNWRSSPSSPFAIYALSAADSAHRQLTHPPDRSWGDHDARESPDGARLAFVRSASEGMQDVYVLETATQKERRLTHDARNIHGVSWLDNGKTLAVASNRAGTDDLWALDVASGRMSRLPVPDTRTAFPFTVPGRSEIVYERVRTDVNIWRADSSGTVEASPWSPSTAWDAHPAVSPAGTHVAFTSSRSGTYEIWLAGTDGEGVRQLTRHGAGYTSRPAWTPDGEAIVYVSRVDGNADLFEVNVTTGVRKRLTETPFDELAPSFDAEGRVLYSTNQNGSWEVGRLEERRATPGALPFRGVMGIQQDPLGNGYLYGKVGSPGLWRGHIDGSEVLEHASLDPRDWGSFNVLPDGEIILFDRAARAVLSVVGGRIDTLATLAFLLPAHDPGLAVHPQKRWMLLTRMDVQESDIVLAEPVR